MAQWLGQYSGHTHETKVRDIEESLRKAVNSLRRASAQEQNHKAKAVRRLSERLLHARHKMIRARISSYTDGRPPNEVSPKVARLLAQERELTEQGVPSILKEFGIIEWFAEDL